MATPGRVIDHLQRGNLDLGQVQHAVLDEADEMLNMGFADDIESIFSYVNVSVRRVLRSIWKACGRWGGELVGDCDCHVKQLMYAVTIVPMAPKQDRYRGNPLMITVVLFATLIFVVCTTAACISTAEIVLWTRN